VSGEPVIDIDNLKRNSKYDNNKYFSEEHPSVQMFWRALRELTPEQKSNFIRFAWGRSRLPRGKWPLQQNGTPVRFTIVPRRNVTTGIPLAHTCFFLIELPEYKDYAVCKKMLNLAVTCALRHRRAIGCARASPSLTAPPAPSPLRRRRARGLPHRLAQLRESPLSLAAGILAPARARVISLFVFFQLF